MLSICKIKGHLAMYEALELGYTHASHHADWLKTLSESRCGQIPTDLPAVCSITRNSPGVWRINNV